LEPDVEYLRVEDDFVVGGDGEGLAGGDDGDDEIE
jgi:hypothetical protein